MMQLIALVVLVMSSHLACSFPTGPKFQRRTSMRQYAKNDGKNPPPPAVKSKFDRVVDDFIGKRYGAGEFFYGAQTSKLSNEEYAEMYGVQSNEPENVPMRENAILIVGSLEAMGQWVAFELAEKGFNIRIASETKETAVNIFGQRNVDIVQLSATATEEDYQNALDGVQAIVFLPMFQPSVFGSNNGRSEMAVAERLLAVATTAKSAKKSDVQKVICVSRSIPRLDSTSGGGGNIFGALFAKQADSSVFASFREAHAGFEDKIRRAGFEYVVVRAPAVVEESKEGARSELLLLDRQGSSIGASSASSNSVGTLDFAEAVTSALIVDVPNVTFTVCESRSAVLERQQEMQEMPLAQSNAMDEEYGSSPAIARSQSDRVTRNAYYGILEMNQDEMKSSYMMKEAEVYQQQLEEDVQLEKFWSSLLQQLPKD
jgi:uncharacterized protein YbjT (DUF2867 family)